MTTVPDYNFEVKRIIVKDTYEHPKGTPEWRQLKWEEYVQKEARAIERNVEKERKGWK
jgi:hypothetical protein